MSDKIKEIISEEEFYSYIKEEKRPILVDFWASWCGPCKMQSPILHSLAEENDKIAILKVNIDENEKLAFDLGIKSIPTLIVYFNGEQKEKTVGLSTKAELAEMLIKYL